MFVLPIEVIFKKWYIAISKKYIFYLLKEIEYEQFSTPMLHSWICAYIPMNTYNYHIFLSEKKFTQMFWYISASVYSQSDKYVSTYLSSIVFTNCYVIQICKYIQFCMNTFDNVISFLRFRITVSLYYFHIDSLPM